MSENQRSSDEADTAPGRKKSVYEYFVAGALGLMALGQWGDTKDVIVEAWRLTLSNFTHQYEYQALDRINVGSNLRYIKNLIGEPQLIKTSKYNDEISFAYYLKEKYILTLIVEENRVSAYTITSLIDDFVPHSLLTKTASDDKTSIADNYGTIEDFTLDFNNIEYLLVKEELGKEKLFVNNYFGAISYSVEVQLPSEELREIYNTLNMDETSSEALTKVRQLTTRAINNFYGAGENDLSVIADSVLTNFEYSLYYKK